MFVWVHLYSRVGYTWRRASRSPRSTQTCGTCTLSSSGRCTPGRWECFLKIYLFYLDTRSFRLTCLFVSFIILIFKLIFVSKSITGLTEFNSLGAPWISDEIFCRSLNFSMFDSILRGAPWISDEIWNPWSQSFDSPSLSDRGKKGAVELILLNSPEVFPNFPHFPPYVSKGLY